VKRRATGRDVQLTMRMAFVSLLLLAANVALAAAVVLLYVAEPSWAPYITLVAIGILGAVVLHYTSSTEILLRSAGVTFDTDTPATADLESRMARLAALADLPVPRIRLATSVDPNALTVGVRQRRAIVVVTTALCDALEPDELDAVLAHELAHIANRDSAVMSLASVPRSVGAAIVGSESGNAFYLWFFIWPLGLLPLAFGTLLTLAMSRYREFAADRGSALITGRPETLMSALTKLDRHTAIPVGDLRAVGALCIVAATPRRTTMLMDHPPLEQRLVQLAEIARAIGEPEQRPRSNS
jgi:heat shock protein HtpX